MIPGHGTVAALKAHRARWADRLPHAGSDSEQTEIEAKIADYDRRIAAVLKTLEGPALPPSGKAILSRQPGEVAPLVSVAPEPARSGAQKHFGIDPPDSDPPPKWARVLVNAANTRNRSRGSGEVFTMSDLAAVWKVCGGRCAVSDLPFNLKAIGDGQAKRPFAPSLDRIDRHKPYHRDNVRLVVSIANFAMNAWGLEPLLQLASALHRKYGDRSPTLGRGPSDSDLDEIATINAEPVETDVGILTFPPRSDMHRPILHLLQNGPRSSRALENALAERFGITEQMRTAMLRSGCPAWRNHVAWALVDLTEHQRGTGEIERIGTRRTPDGGSMGIYRLMPSPLANISS